MRMLWLPVVFTVLVGFLAAPSEADVVITCANATCANGANCTNFDLENADGDLIPHSIFCDCGVGTFGANCERCKGSETGTWEIYDDWTGSMVRTAVASLFALSLFTIAVVWGVSMCLHSEYQHANDYRLDSLVDSSGQPNPEKRLVDYQLAPRGGHNRGLPKIDDYTLAFALFFAGVICFTFVFTAKPYDAKVSSWYGTRTHHPLDCRTFSAPIYMGLILMTLSGYIILCHIRQTLGQAKYVAARLNGSAVPTPDLLTNAGLDYNRAGFWRTMKWVCGIVAGIMIIGRFVDANMHGTRTCCERLIANDSTDEVFSSLLIGFLGLDFFASLWILFFWIIGSHTDARLDTVVRDQLAASLGGSRSSWSRWSFYGFFVVRMGIVAGSLIVLAFDVSAYGIRTRGDDGLLHSHREGGTEPMVKGYIMFFVVMAFVWAREFFYYWNVYNHTAGAVNNGASDQAADDAALLKNASGHDSEALRAWHDRLIYGEPSVHHSDDYFTTALRQYIQADALEQCRKAKKKEEREKKKLAQAAQLLAASQAGGAPY